MSRSESENEELSFVSIHRDDDVPSIRFYKIHLSRVNEILSDIFLFVHALLGSGNKFYKKISKPS